MRAAADYDRTHIDGARHLSEAKLAAIMAATPKMRPVLIYCYHGNARRVYGQIFADFHFRVVYSLDGGFDGWCATEAGPAS